MIEAGAAITNSSPGSLRGEYGGQNPVKYALRFRAEVVYVDANQRCRPHRHLQGRSTQQISHQLAQQRFVSGKQDLRFALPAPDLVPDAPRSGNGYQRIGADNGPGIVQYLGGDFRALQRSHIGASENERRNHTHSSRPLENLLHFRASTGRELARRIGTALSSFFRPAMAQQMNLHSLYVYQRGNINFRVCL